jgi:hypothetical protein
MNTYYFRAENGLFEDQSVPTRTGQLPLNEQSMIDVLTTAGISEVFSVCMQPWSLFLSPSSEVKIRHDFYYK